MSSASVFAAVGVLPGVRPSLAGAPAELELPVADLTAFFTAEAAEESAAETFLQGTWYVRIMK
jgi:hypothetical protein